MTQVQLDAMLVEHGKWAADPYQGKRSHIDPWWVTPGDVCLQGLSFRGANLYDVDWRNVDLRNCDFTDASLVDADLSGSDLSGCDFRNARMKNTNLIRCRMEGAKLPYDVPFVPDIYKRIVHVLKNGGSLGMTQWHGGSSMCHCLGGWAVWMAGDYGEALEASLGTLAAGALIVVKSDDSWTVPNFYGTADEAMALLRDRISSSHTRLEG